MADSAKPPDTTIARRRDTSEASRFPDPPIHFFFCAAALLIVVALALLNPVVAIICDLDIARDAEPLHALYTIAASLIFRS